MDVLKELVQALHHAASSEPRREEIEACITHLSTALRLLELHVLSDTTSQQLTHFLRQHMVPLYRALPTQGLGFCAAVLLYINKTKITACVEAGDVSNQKLWELIQASLISGVLDYIEEHPTIQKKMAVACALFPTLCQLYCLGSLSSISRAEGLLLCTVYQLLSETAHLQRENQRKLRDPNFLGPKRMGVVLSHLRDFIAIEAFLELFANILPSLKIAGGRKERSRFINDVFDPELYTCSKEIIVLLESIKISDWDITAVKVTDALARSDISYPQPFSTTQLLIRGSEPKLIDRIYIDNKGVLVNLKDNDNVETFRTPFANIQKIRLSAPSAGKTTLTMLLTSPPVVGKSPMSGLDTDKITLSCDLQIKDLDRLLNSFNNRGLAKIVNSSQCKLSKAENEITLDFDEQQKSNPSSTQEKLKNISRIWANAEPTDSANIAPTSPLYSPVASSRIPVDVPLVSIAELNPDVPGITIPLGVRFSDGSILESSSTTEPRELSKQKFKQKPKEKSHCQTRKGRRVLIILDSDDEINAVRPSGRQRKSVESDLSQKTGSSNSISDVAEPKEPATTSMTQDKELLQMESEHITKIVDCEKLPRRSLRNSKPVLPIPSKPLALEKEPNDANAVISIDLQVNSGTPALNNPASNTRNVRKRKESENLDSSNHTDPISNHTAPNKRAKKEDTEIKPSVVPRRPPAVKRYGRKVRVSSPTFPMKPSVDFDVLPDSGDDHSNKTTESKHGKLPASVKCIVTGGKKFGTKVMPAKTQVESEGEKREVIDVDCLFLPEMGPVKDIANGTNTTPPQTAKLAAKPQMKKLKKAPWEESGFLSKRKDHERNEALVEEPHAKGSDSSDPSLITNHKDITLSDVPGFGYFEDSFVPIEPAYTSSDENVAPYEETTVIDPTNAANTLEKPSLTLPHFNSLSIRSPALPPTPKHKKQSERQRSPFDLPNVLNDPIFEADTPRRRPSPVFIRAQTKVKFEKIESPKIFQELNNHKERSFKPQKQGRRSTFQEPRSFVETAKRSGSEDAMNEIFEVISGITDVIKDKVFLRFDNTRKDIEAGRKKILFDIVNDLQEIHYECATQYNDLLGLEDEYAKQGHRMIGAWEDVRKATENMSQGIQDIMKDHNRHSIVKNFPTSLLFTSLPAAITKPTISVTF